MLRGKHSLGSTQKKRRPFMLFVPLMVRASFVCQVDFKVVEGKHGAPPDAEIGTSSHPTSLQFCEKHKL